jgi:hypothetical protein
MPTCYCCCPQLNRRTRTLQATRWGLWAQLQWPLRACRCALQSTVPGSNHQSCIHRRLTYVHNKRSNSSLFSR